MSFMLINRLAESPIRIPPGKLFLTHGEPSASSALKDRIKSELGWNSEVAEDMQEVLL